MNANEKWRIKWYVIDEPAKGKEKKRKFYYAVVKKFGGLFFSACIRMNRECVHCTDEIVCVRVPRCMCANVSLE